MLTVNFDPFPLLTTDRLVMRPMHVDDAPEMFFLRSDEGVMKYIDRPRAQSIDDAVQFINRITDAVVSNDNITWAITLKGNNTLIGNISFWRMDKENHRAELGYVLHPAHHRKGIMDEALKAALNYGFHTMRLHSVEANVNPENIGSIKLLERNNFIREAYFRENYYFDGRFLDSAIYSLITPIRKPAAI